jgi:hypothetical protein
VEGHRVRVHHTRRAAAAPGLPDPPVRADRRHLHQCPPRQTPQNRRSHRPARPGCSCPRPQTRQAAHQWSAVEVRCLRGLAQAGTGTTEGIPATQEEKPASHPHDTPATPTVHRRQSQAMNGQLSVVRRQGLEPRTRGLRANPVISSGFGLCQLVSFPQVSNESPCRRVASSAAPVHGHRALMEHRDRQSVLHRRTRWGSGATAEAADFGSAGSLVTVTWSVAPVRSDRWAGRGGSHSRSGGATHRWRREDQCDRVTRRRAGPAVRCGQFGARLCRLIGAFPQGGGGSALPSGAKL